ncbi:MAG: flagellar hook-length control protein FliK [Candidatus Zixiibacteriota bacterium]|nr:MAG: flagellar hook-length control protein FliK [candidate division Zixibacteria bacterium]
MTQTPLNIFDLLMGDLTGLPTAPAVGTGAPADGVPGMFSDIISGYLAAGPTATTGQQGEVFASPEFPITDGIAGKSTHSKQIADNVAEFNRQLLSVLPRQMGVINANVKDVLTNHVAELKPGRYQILSSRVYEGRVCLEVTPKDSPQHVIKLTLPAEALMGTDASVASRVALGYDNYESQRLSGLLRTLNLKEIEVKTASTQQPIENSAEPLKITIVAEGTAGEVLIKSKLSRSQFRAVSVDKPVEGRTVVPQRPVSTDPIINREPAAPAEHDFLHGKILSGNAKAPTEIGTRTPLAEPDLLETFGEKSAKTRSTESQQVFDSLFASDATSADGEPSVEKSQPRSVRLNLPENLSTTVKPNGRAVTIRIEPEHLGPARLSLSMVDHKLKARIVVDSVPAKVALESNIDRLMNQLSKADIKVDQIEITINGDSTHNQYLGRQPHWRHRMITRIPAVEPQTSDKGDIPITPSALSAEYLGAGGVNVLA